MRVFSPARNRLKTNAVPGTAFPLIGNLPNFKVVPKKKNFLGRGIQAKAVGARLPVRRPKPAIFYPSSLQEKKRRGSGFSLRTRGPKSKAEVSHRTTRQGKPLVILFLGHRMGAIQYKQVFRFGSYLEVGKFFLELDRPAPFDFWFFLIFLRSRGPSGRTWSGILEGKGMIGQEGPTGGMPLD